MTVGESMAASAASTVVPPPSGPHHSQGQADVAQQVPRGPGTSPMANPMALKVNQEVLTSLHLIKDIRRLEKYQRDFFLKVKESLTHVHALLDHQLMDMAWSDNLADCEENLLKVSTHVQTSSSSQLADVYNILLHDREKLNNRFQELSVKSSLSEFVVNSRQLLDINAVRMAAETILKNEKPSPAQGDHNIPVDHTFFLANFCTTSLASSMMASFVPKPVSIIVEQDSRGQQGTGYQQAAQPQSSGSGHQGQSQPQQQAPPSRRINGQQQPSQVPQQGNQTELAGAGPDIDASNGIAINQGGAVVPPPGMTMRDVEGGLDKYLAVVNGGNMDLNGGALYPGTGRCELVSAISQIAQKPDSKKKGPKNVDPWGKMTEPASAHDTSTDGSDEATATASPVAPTAPAVASTGGGELNLPNDASSDSISTESDDRAGNNDASVASGSSDKPLSFARIASLNIDKSSIARPPKAVPGPGSTQGPNNLLAMALASPQMPPQPLSMPPSLSSTMVTNLMAGPPPPPPQGSAPQPMMGLQTMPMISLPPSNNPRFFFDIQAEGKRLGRVIIEVQASVAPKMALNFSMLVTGERGFGYKGCQFFQAWRNESVICGDWEHNSGRGGRAALDGGPLFTPDDTRLPCVRGAVGMRRMSKKHSSLNQVASQFRIILANMNTQFTGIFGHIVSGIEALDKVADMGGEGGRPEKTALVSNCGIYKP